LILFFGLMALAWMVLMRDVRAWLPGHVAAPRGAAIGSGGVPSVDAVRGVGNRSADLPRD